MEYVFLLQHCYENEIKEGIIIEEVKIIGIYSTREKAEQTIKKFMKLPGFRDFPEDCFTIGIYSLDKDYWATGFVTMVVGEDEEE